MKKALVVLGVMLMSVGVAHAQVHFEFHCTGSGNMVKTGGPVVYSGQIDGGDLAPGTWQISVDDTGWPAVGNDALRWDYIWTNYYVYDPVYYLWTGTFENNDLYLEKTSSGEMFGVCDLTFQVLDNNENGVMDPEECMDGLSGAVIIINEGTGIYSHLCGQGTYQGFYFRDCDTESDYYMLDNVDFDMYLDLEDCGMATGISTWSAVKSLFN